MGELLEGLSADRLALAEEVARVPEKIRGFGHVKELSVANARQQVVRLMQQWRAPVEPNAEGTWERARAA